MNNLSKIAQTYKDNKTNNNFPTSNWIKSRIALEVLNLVPAFDFSEAEEDEDSYFVDSVCFFLRKYSINPQFLELWVSYLKKTPWGQVYEVETKINTAKDLVKVYAEKMDITKK